MKDKEAVVLLTTFISGILGSTSTIYAGAESFAVPTKDFDISNSVSNKIFVDADGYLGQILVQSRYQDIPQVVWVYGCTDQT